MSYSTFWHKKAGNNCQKYTKNISILFKWIFCKDLITCFCDLKINWSVKKAYPWSLLKINRINLLTVDRFERSAWAIWSRSILLKDPWERFDQSSKRSKDPRSKVQKIEFPTLNKENFFGYYFWRVYCYTVVRDSKLNFKFILRNLRKSIISGWGRLETGGPQPNILQKANVT